MEEMREGADENENSDRNADSDVDAPTSRSSRLREVVRHSDTILAMLRLLFTLIVTSSIASARDEPYALRAGQMYAGAGRAIMLDADTPDDPQLVDLVLMDHAGLVVAPPASVRSGVFDLAEVMPAAEQAIIDRGRACYLQMVIDEVPRGSALVLQPLLDPLVPITEIATHPTRGHKHTRVVGWRTLPAGPDDEGAEDEPPLSPRAYAGLRIEPERDIRLDTTHGAMRIALRPDEAPNTARNFRSLCAQGFYDDVVFHRIVPVTATGDPFVIQGGDPSGTGEGGPGYGLALEPSELDHDFGVISMARADAPDSAGSQFFICLSRAGTARLDGQYCAFGYAVAGASTILEIADVELADIATGRPVNPPTIITTQLVAAPPRRPLHGRPDERVSRERPAPATQPETPQRQPR